MNLQKLLYVFTRAPYSNAQGQEALDAVLVGAAFEQHVSVLFLHDGVYQIMTNQDTAGSALKPVSKAYRALPDFAVDDIYVHDLSLAARGLDANQLIVDGQIVSALEVQQLLSDQTRVFTF